MAEVKNRPDSGKLILVIGGTGSGKTTFIKEKILKGKPECLVYDVNNEYDELDMDANAPRGRWWGAVKGFIAITPFKHNGCIVVFEEATGFFEGAATKETKQIIVGKRHSLPPNTGGRNLIFVFHTINSVPPFLFGTANTVCLMKTNDEPHQVKRKCAKLLAPFLKLQNAPQYSRINVKMM
jgi:hypothetical protein